MAAMATRAVKIHRGVDRGLGALRNGSPAELESAGDPGGGATL